MLDLLFKTRGAGRVGHAALRASPQQGARPDETGPSHVRVRQPREDSSAGTRLREVCCHGREQVQSQEGFLVHSGTGRRLEEVLPALTSLILNTTGECG